MSAPAFVLAVPSKGRLQENAASFFRRLGLPFEQGGSERSYRGRLGGLAGVEVAYLSASEIARELAAGSVHFGVTGADLIHETLPDPAACVEFVAPLGFGHADVVVAVPKSWIDVTSMADLADVAADFRARHGRWIRVATKFVRLTRTFFARHGIADYRIVESLGATEGAPAAGSAELIVDITTTGQTLAANDLMIVSDGVILRSEAHLVASIGASWTTPARAAASAILDRIAADAAARAIREVRALLPDPEEAAQVAAERYQASAPFGATPGHPLVLHVAARHAPDLASLLHGRGAKAVVVAAVETVFSTENHLIGKLESRIGPLA